jgi:hypothetical protein
MAYSQGVTRATFSPSLMAGHPIPKKKKKKTHPYVRVPPCSHPPDVWENFNFCF